MLRAFFRSPLFAAVALMTLSSVGLAPWPKRLEAQPAVSPQAWQGIRPWLSSAGERLFREELAAGRFLNHPLARWIAETELMEPAPGLEAEPFLPAPISAGPGNDALVNDRNPTTCPGCQNLPLIQTEASVAVHGSNVVVSWNEGKSSCPNLGSISRQSYGYSSDAGQTFVDANGFPATDVGGRHTGDATVAANHKTGFFYIAGLHSAMGFDGVAGAKGHFNGASFVFDRLTRAVTEPIAGDFFDKPWMTVDSLTGNTYFSWTNFSDAGSVRIEFQRCDADLNPIGPIHVMSDLLVEACGGQWSQLAVGPDGEVYAIWLEFECGTNNDPLPRGRVVVRRSDDFGASFGPKVVIAQYAANTFNGAPGFLRRFRSLQPSITVDCTNGPYRGRVHVAWDESVDYTDDTLLLTTTRFETEPNNSDATANVLVPGGKLRGTKNGVDDDWFQFDAQAGETFLLADVLDLSTPGGYDSTRVGLYAQIFCREPGGQLRLVANGTGNAGGGLLWSPPRAGTYYLKLTGLGPDVDTYVFYTAFIPPGPNERARDHSDQTATYSSDDGATWSTPQRISTSAAGFDGQYPSLAVDGNGIVHCIWMDFREDSDCGAKSRQVVASSADGGVTWGQNRPLGDVAFFWPPQGALCNQLNGNTQGDYQHTAADGDLVIAAFTDARFGDPDIIVDASSIPVSVTPGPAVAAFLAAPQPNPSMGSMRVRFGLERSERARVSLYAINGARVRTLVDEVRASGVHDLEWDGRDDQGRSVASGAYFLKLTAGTNQLRRTVMVLR